MVIVKRLMDRGRWSENPSVFSASATEKWPIYEENPKVCWSPLELQHRDVVGLGGAEQGSWDIKSLLRAPGRPVSAQVDAINPDLALIQQRHL